MRKLSGIGLVAAVLIAGCGGSGDSSAVSTEQRVLGGVKLTTSYPVLQGPSDAKFEFSMEVDSDLDKDAVFDLFANYPHFRIPGSQWFGNQIIALGMLYFRMKDLF